MINEAVSRSLVPSILLSCNILKLWGALIFDLAETESLTGGENDTQSRHVTNQSLFVVLGATNSCLRPLQVPSAHPVINATLPSQAMILKSNGLMTCGFKTQAINPNAATPSLPGMDI